MPEFKIVNNSTWEVTKVEAKTVRGAKDAFLNKKGLEVFDQKAYTIHPPKKKEGAKISKMSLSAFEQSQSYKCKK